ncbi:hypothetical protein TNCV_4841961 [Trichonephila clavipes]|uniref:Uncharacterized protein n=1 Tax=Trichonephila clavipes TaxID=2585209 RepID=A0A8X7BLQ2_TRICX|nr:hypothetical protein TNCV_4841961 [Trichonephila clavipes]
MTKFIDFCEVWFLPESVARVVAAVISNNGGHCWRSLPITSALIQKDFGCVPRVLQTKQLPYVAKVDLVWQLGV